MVIVTSCKSVSIRAARQHIEGESKTLKEKSQVIHTKVLHRSKTKVLEASLEFRVLFS